MMALSAASSLADYAEKRNIASQKEAYARATAQQAAQARDLKIQQLGVRAEQQAEAIAAKKQQNVIEALQIQERALVAAGEASIGGNVVKMKAFDIEAQKLRKDRDYTLQNAAIQQQISMEAMGIDAQAVRTINSLPRGQEPSFVKALVSAGSAAVSADKTLGDGKFASAISESFGELKEDFLDIWSSGDLLSNDSEALPFPDEFYFDEG